MSSNPLFCQTNTSKPKDNHWLITFTPRDLWTYWFSSENSNLYDSSWCDDIQQEKVCIQIKTGSWTDLQIKFELMYKLCYKDYSVDSEVNRLNCKIKKRKTLFMTPQHENKRPCNKLYQRLLVRLLWDSAWPTWPRRIVLRYSNGTGWKCSCNKELQAENDHCHSVQYESLWKHEAAGEEWQFEQCSQALSIYIHQNKTRMYFKSLKGGVNI